MKLMVVAYNFPPVSKASANVAGSLFRNWDFGEYFVVRGSEQAKGNVIDNAMSIDCPQYVCDMPSCFRSRSFKVWLPVYLEHLWISVIARKFKTIIKKEAPSAIFMMFPNHFYGIASYYAVKKTSIPLFCYFVDEWKQTRTHWLQRLTGKYYEPRIIKLSSKIFFMTDALRDVYISRYPGEDIARFETLPLPTELEVSAQGGYRKIDLSKSVTICFTGAIYGSQQQAILNLVHAIKLISDIKINLQLITFQSKEALDRIGISGDFIEVFKVTRSEVLKWQKKADILFLPMSFKDHYDIVTMVSIPSKLLEYITSQRPILVHAPENTFIGQYAKETQFGLLVSENDHLELARAISNLISDGQQQAKFVRNSVSLHAKHFAPRVKDQLFTEMAKSVNHNQA